MKKLIMPLAGLLAFLLAVTVTLGARGALTRESLSHAPVVGGLFKGGHGSEGEHGEVAADGHGEAGEHGQSSGGHGQSSGHGEEGESPLPPHPDGQALAASFDLPRPFEAEDLERLVARLRGARMDYAERLRTQAALGDALEHLGRELEERRVELEGLMAALSEERAQLQRDKAALAAERASFKAGEGDALRPLAKAFEEMQPAPAAERLALFEVDRAAKVLALMRSRKAAKLLEALPAAQAAEVSSRLAALRAAAPPEEENP